MAMRRKALLHCRPQRPEEELVISERGVIGNGRHTCWSGVNIHGWGNSPLSLLRLWGLLTLPVWPEGNGMLDMEVYCGMPAEKLESKPKERGQEGLLV